MSERFVVIPTSENTNRPIIIVCAISIILAIIFGYLWICTIKQIKNDKEKDNNNNAPDLTPYPASDIPDEDLLKPEPLPFDGPETSYSGFDNSGRMPMPQAQVQAPTDGLPSFDMGEGFNPMGNDNTPSFDSPSYMPKAYGSKGSGKGVRIK